jgi:Family of unknown function (DUF5681)
MPPDKTGKKQAGHFARGQSGNPEGRPKGSRNATTLALETLLDGQATALTQKAIGLALTGDMAALRLCLDRILPPRKDRPLTFDFPAITNAAEAASTMSAILGAVASGEITPTEASEIGKLVDSYVRAVEATELAARIERLERMTSPIWKPE